MKTIRLLARLAAVCTPLTARAEVDVNVTSSGAVCDLKPYPGENHGFSHRATATLDGPKRFFEDSNAFFKRHLPTQSKPIEKSLIKEVAVGLEKGRGMDHQEP